MNIIFMRHGNATDNVKGIISDKEIYWSTLTEEGRKTVLESIETLPSKIDKIYVSPLPRTIETAHLVSQKYKTSDFIIEKRIREINNGKYSVVSLGDVNLRLCSGRFLNNFFSSKCYVFEILTID